jgi:glycogen(starch) synthase
MTSPVPPLKVLMFGWEYPPNISGGLGTACYGIAKGLAQIGDVEISLALPQLRGNEDARHVRLLAPPAEAARNARLPTAYAGAAFEIAQRYGRVAEHYVDRAGQFDLIHAHDWLTAPVAQLAKRLSGKPLVLHIHSTEHDRSGPLADPQILALEREAMDAADCVVAVSAATRAQIVTRFGQPPDKVRAIYNGIDPSPLRQRPASREPVVTFLGRVTYQKGPALFLEAAARAAALEPSLRFVLAGDGDLLPAMRALARSLGIADRLLFTGFLDSDEVQHLLDRSTVLVMPSLAEPFGLVALEAIDAGVPVVLSAHAGVAERFEHVVKVDPHDADAVAAAVVALCRDEKRAERLRSGARAEMARLGWTDCAAHLKTLYRSLLHSHRPASGAKELIGEQA